MAAQLASAAAASSPAALRKSLHHLSTLWPTDALRPHLSLPNLLRQKADSIAVPSEGAPASTTTGGLGPSIAATGTVNRALHDEVVAGMALVEGRVSAVYPVSPRLLHPTTMAEYYVDLARELEVAPTRGWLDGVIASWKGYIRAK